MKNLRHRQIFILISILFFVLDKLSLTDAWGLNLHNRKNQSKFPDTVNDYGDEFFLQKQLNTARCPAKIGRDLKDYWKCLWRTSITVQGMERHRQLKKENIAKNLKQNNLEPDLHQNRNNKSESIGLNETKKDTVLKRVKRNADKDHLHLRSLTIIEGIEETLTNAPKTARLCQQTTIGPGKSLNIFLECLRVNSPVKDSLDPIFDLPEDPALDNSFDPNEFRILTDEQTGLNFGKEGLKFEFYYIGERNTYKEETSFNFDGGDPYLSEQGSEYRYKFDNLRPGDLPGWSYSGLHSPSKWHTLDPRKFFLPISQAVDMKDLTTASIFAQSYPGLGEIAPILSDLDLHVPYDVRWKKDYGYFAYSRFLLPLLSKTDLQYYKSKKYIPGDVYFRNDREQVQEIIDALLKFENLTQDFLRNQTSKKVNPKYLNEADIPLADVYIDFLHHYFQIEISEYREWNLRKYNDTALHYEFETVRQVMRAYVQVVKAQLNCTKELVETYDERRDAIDYVGIVQHAYAACSKRAPPAPAGDPANNTYRVSETTIQQLYLAYFDRKEARRRYTLPVYPFQYPICQHNEQSPLNIIRANAIKSSLRNYHFGESAYYMQKMYMKYSFDGSNTISVGIVGGERMDGSAPKLSGGALKGVNLTFQQFNVRFSHDWEKQGSEHSFDGEAAPMELQFLFTVAGSADKLKYWHILARVQNQIYALRERLVVMIAILVDVVETDEELIEKCKETGQDPFIFEPISQTVYHLRKRVENFPQLDEPRSYISKDPIFRLIDFIPKKKSFYYTYRGSLSWPPCFGYVLWSVFEERLLISKRQFSEFAKIPSFATSNNNYASDNIRKPGDIYVADEQKPELSYKDRKRLVDLRTTDRHVLQGIHDPNKFEDDVFDDEVYTIGEGGEESSKAYSLNRREFTWWWCVLLANLFVFTI